MRYAGDILQDISQLAWYGGEFRVQVTDAEGLMLLTVIIVAVDAAAFLSHEYPCPG
jgi:hypothetical protein